MLENIKKLSQSELILLTKQLYEVLESELNFDFNHKIQSDKIGDLVNKFIELDQNDRLEILVSLPHFILNGYIEFDKTEFDQYFKGISPTIRILAVQRYCKEKNIHPMYLVDERHLYDLLRYPDIGNKTYKTVINFIKQKRCI